MAMEFTVNRLMAWAKTLESALHGHGLWTFRTSAGVTPAHRLITREEILFVGQALPTPDGVVELWLDEDLVTMTHADFSQGSSVTWRLRPGMTVAA